MLGLHCCAESSPAASGALSAAGVLPAAAAPLGAGHGLSDPQASGVVTQELSSCIPGLWRTSSGVGAHALSCSEARGIILGQGSNPRLLHRQVDSLPPSHLGGPATSPATYLNTPPLVLSALPLLLLSRLSCVRLCATP